MQSFPVAMFSSVPIKYTNVVYNRKVYTADCWLYSSFMCLAFYRHPPHTHTHKHKHTHNPTTPILPFKHIRSTEWKIKYYPTIKVASRSPLRHRAADVRDSTDPLCKCTDTQTAREMCYTFTPPHTHRRPPLLPPPQLCLQIRFHIRDSDLTTIFVQVNNTYKYTPLKATSCLWLASLQTFKSQF